MCKPIESRKRLLDLIRKSDHPLQLDEVREFEDKEALWFGPGVDAIDFLFAKEALGVVHIDLRTRQVVALQCS